ncbi:hypothetical protein KBZ15_08725, partial [Cyanobium sp. BA20m-p-22]|uniref:hypothetical protein n=1 Tax=Cyanobium sp. BA20m-p-22 TaxID=2823704 RepID=UPI0020CFA111
MALGGVYEDSSGLHGQASELDELLINSGAHSSASPGASRSIDFQAETNLDPGQSQDYSQAANNNEPGDSSNITRLDDSNQSPDSSRGFEHELALLTGHLPGLSIDPENQIGRNEQISAASRADQSIEAADILTGLNSAKERLPAEGTLLGNNLPPIEANNFAADSILVHQHVQADLNSTTFPNSIS